MRSLVSLVIVVAVVLGGYFLFLKRVQPDGTSGSPAQAISLTGVRSDLLAMAQAERAYFALNGSYASLDQLIQSGSLTMTRTGRDGYTYSVETSAGGFDAIARYTGEPGKALLPGMPTLAVDQNMTAREIK